MSSSAAPDGTSSQSTLSLARVGGFALIGAAIALLICRYALWPMQAGAMRLVVGAAIGGIVGGRRLINNGDDPHRVAELGAMAGVGALVAAVMYFGFAPVPFTESRLSVVELPGARISLPGSPVVQGDQSHGQIKIQDPGGEGALAVVWQPGVGLTEDELVLVMEILGKEVGGTAKRADFQRSVSGHPSSSSVISGKAEGLATAWNCEQHQRAFFLLTHARASKTEIRAMHERILDSVECHIGEAPETKWILPSFPAELGLGYVADSDPPTFVTPQGEFLMFTVAGEDLPKQLSEHPNLIKAMIESGSDKGIARFNPVPESRRSGAQSREVWHGVMEDTGDRYWMEISPFGCGDYSLTGVSVRAYEDSDLPVSEALLAARCPSEGDPPPKDVRDAAKEACSAGNVDSCYAFSSVSLEDEEFRGWLVGSCEDGMTAACEALDAE